MIKGAISVVKGAAVCLACLVLQACQSTLPTDNPATERPKSGFLSAIGAPKAPARKTPLAKVSFAGGDVVVAGPEGYCLDPATIQNRPERGFALIASCNRLSGGKLGPYVAPVVVSVTIGPRGDGDLPTAEEIASSAGAPLLAARSEAGLILAQLGTGGDAMMATSDSRYWRGTFVQNGRLIGLALYAPKGTAEVGDAGAQMLAQVRGRIQSLSGQQFTAASGTPKKPPLFAGLFKR